MVSVTITHLIGTTALILVFVSSTLFYNYAYSAMQTDALLTQLWEMSEYVSSSLSDLVFLCLGSESDQFLVAKIEGPKNLRDSFYRVAVLEDVNPTTLEKSIVVRTTLDTGISSWIKYRDAAFPLNNVAVWNGTAIDHPAELMLRLNVSSNTPNIAVWVSKKGSDITIGLGTISSS